MWLKSKWLVAWQDLSIGGANVINLLYYVFSKENRHKIFWGAILIMDVIEHLKSRHCDLELHKPYIGDECASFMLYNLSGQITGYQQYRPLSTKQKSNNPKESRYFTYSPKNSISLFGFETFSFSRTLFVVEGIFDACKASYLGYSVLAVLSSNPNPSVKQLFQILRANRPVVSICDSGFTHLKKIGHNFHEMKQGDLGDASLEEAEHILRRYT